MSSSNLFSLDESAGIPIIETTNDLPVDGMENGDRVAVYDGTGDPVLYQWDSTPSEWVKKGPIGTYPSKSDFPSNPSDGDLVINSGSSPPVLNEYDGANSEWIKRGPVGKYSGSSNFPSSPSDGDLAIDNSVTPPELYEYDGSVPEWIKRGPVGKFSGTSDFPSDPNNGDLAIDNGVTPPEIYEYDGSVPEWVKRGPVGKFSGTSDFPSDPNGGDLAIDNGGRHPIVNEYDSFWTNDWVQRGPVAYFNGEPNSGNFSDGDFIFDAIGGINGGIVAKEWDGNNSVWINRGPVGTFSGTSNFPPSPSDGDLAIDDSVSPPELYQYDSNNTVWNSVGGQNPVVSDTLTSNPDHGEALLLDLSSYGTSTDKLLLNYDGNNSRWMLASTFGNYVSVPPVINGSINTDHYTISNKNSVSTSVDSGDVLHYHTASGTQQVCQARFKWVLPVGATVRALWAYDDISNFPSQGSMGGGCFVNSSAYFDNLVMSFVGADNGSLGALVQTYDSSGSFDTEIATASVSNYGPSDFHTTQAGQLRRNQINSSSLYHFGSIDTNAGNTGSGNEDQGFNDSPLYAGYKSYTAPFVDGDYYGRLTDVLIKV